MALHISHTIETTPPSEPLQITLDLLPTHKAVVQLTGAIAVKCTFGEIHLVPVNQMIVVSSKSPKPLLNAAEDMIRYLSRGRYAMCDLLIGMILTEWVDPCLEPADEDPDLVGEEAQDRPFL